MYYKLLLVDKYEKVIFYFRLINYISSYDGTKKRSPTSYIL